MSRAAPTNGLYCPVCEAVITFIWIWQDPHSSRVRMFCEQCSHTDEYRPLPKNERVIYSYEGFQRFAGRRLLKHVLDRERDKRAEAAGAEPKATLR